MKPIVFFTIVDDNYFYSAGTHILINSFKKYHPDIPLVVYRQDMIDKIFTKKKVNFYNAKPTFAKLLADEYELVVNIDCDTVITGRLTEVIDGKYDVGGAWNFNSYENASFENIDEKMYVQAGLVGSRDKKFWDIWEKANKDWEKYVRKENDVLNLVWYNDPYVSKLNKVIYDKDNNYLGCKSLGREAEMYIFADKLMLDGQEVKAYHHAKGDVRPKLVFETMGFTPQVTKWLHETAYQGISFKVEAI